ncbi:UDP-3-O-acylglucosamine N-acyltransferase [Chlamydiales bacterium SCGC AG-110-M15]|nr:UDP-3-O-acylglucosamine N-acyltransferase [Chlamydiales bacterium SCGC AG-110-M15]
MKFTLSELAKLTGSELIGDPNHKISNVADLDSAGVGDAAFFAPPAYVAARYETAMKNSQAGVTFLSDKSLIIDGRNFLINESPSRAFQVLLEKFLDARGSNTGFAGIHSSAIIHESAIIAEDVEIGPLCVIDKNVHIAKGTKVGAQVFLGASACIGEDCLIHPQVCIREYCTLGNRVILQPGAIIGSCGFGYTTDERGKHTKLEQLGTVVIDDDVEIGANTCIDRSRFKETRVGQGTKVDNLVQVAHGAELGQDNLMISLSAIAGSTKLGDRVVFAGQTAAAGHLTITNDCIFAGRSGITKSIKESGRYAGMPAVKLNDYNRMQAHQKRLADYVKEIKEMKKRIEELEKGS